MCCKVHFTLLPLPVWCAEKVAALLLLLLLVPLHSCCCCLPPCAIKDNELSG